MWSFLEQRTPSNVALSTDRFYNSELTRLDINSELDELDREEFFRLKKAYLTWISSRRLLTFKQVQGKKQRDTAAQDAEMLAKRKAAEKADESNDKENVRGSVDVLGEQDDPDVIFWGEETGLSHGRWLSGTIFHQAACSISE